MTASLLATSIFQFFSPLYFYSFSQNELKNEICELTASCLLPDGWCLEAFTLAQGRMMEELTNILIMLVVGKVCVLWGLLKVIFQNSGFLCVGRSVLSTTFFQLGKKEIQHLFGVIFFGYPNKIYNKGIRTHISPLDIRF